MSEGVRVGNVGSVRPADSLGDVLVLFKAAREWSIEVDEQVRAEGHQPTGVTLGVPVEQLDTIIVILERAVAEQAEAEGVVRKALRLEQVAWRALVICLGAAAANVVAIVVNWWF